MNTNKMEPIAVLRFSTFDGGKENALDLLRNRTAPAAINRNAINFTNRCYFCSRAGEERFVSAQKIFERHCASHNAMTKITPDTNHGIARDSHQNRISLVISYQLTIANDEETLTRPLGQMSFAVQ